MTANNHQQPATAYLRMHRIRQRRQEGAELSLLREVFKALAKFLQERDEQRQGMTENGSAASSMR